MAISAKHAIETPKNSRLKKLNPDAPNGMAHSRIKTNDNTPSIFVLFDFLSITSLKAIESLYINILLISYTNRILSPQSKLVYEMGRSEPPSKRQYF